MGLLGNHKVRGSAARLIEEQAYAQAVREVESGKRRDGLWGKALASTQGDMDAAQAKYIKLRVQSLIDEARVSQSIDKAIEQEAEQSKQQTLRERDRAEKERKKIERHQEFQCAMQEDRADFFPAAFWFGWSLISGIFGIVIVNAALTEGIASGTPQSEILMMLGGPPIVFFFTLLMGLKARRLESQKQ